jgi:hypothetical protein
MSPYEKQSVDELNPNDYENWLDWKDTADPQFETLDIPEDKSPKRDCPVCGMPDITDCELTLNKGKCPGCDSEIIDWDVPF